MEKSKGTPSPLQRAKEKLILLEKRLELKEGLPFLYGWKWYPWAREFYESTHKLNFLCAANQISKSSTQIRKCINWATNQPLWEILWRHQPKQFWYLYPTSNQATIEFETKWKQFLPTGKYKEEKYDDQGELNPYHWKEVFKNRDIFSIHFINTGVFVYFKTYSQDSQALQTGTVDALFCDEELPVETYDELIFRLSASDGYFHMVFTATLGQDFWRQVMEPGEHEEEKLPQAKKWVVSMYDCLLYEDDTPSHWTQEKIQLVINRCGTHQEVLKRVHGRFILTGGRKYEQFDMKRHMKPVTPLPSDWLVYAGVDVGSGGAKNHPGAIAFVGVSPQYDQARVFLRWRGDGQQTAAGDVMEKFQEMRRENKLKIMGQFYDWSCADFLTIAQRMGEPFMPADKSHERGEQIINVLFKNNMLTIDDTAELHKLGSELASLRKDAPKRRAKDDFADALRYAVTRIPFDWSVISSDKPEGFEAGEKVEKSEKERQIERRRGIGDSEDERAQKLLEDEFDEFNEMAGG